MNLISNDLRSRLLALAVLGGIIVVLWTLLIAPIWWRWQDQQEILERSTRLLAAYKGAEAIRPVLEERLRQAQQQGASTSGLIDGNNAALAAATLQSDLRVILEANGGQIRSTQNLPSSMIDNFEKVEIGSDFSIPMGRLKDAAFQIESHSPFFFIEKVEVRSPENWQRVDANVPPPNLEVHLVVSAYRWAGAK